MIPCVDDAAAHMFAFRGRLVGTGGLLDVDREFLFGSVIWKKGLAFHQEGQGSP